MDQVKHEVKMAKTTEQIEKKALAYEEAVTSFDQQAGKVIALLDQLPAIKQNHLVRPFPAPSEHSSAFSATWPSTSSS